MDGSLQETRKDGSLKQSNQPVYSAPVILESPKTPGAEDVISICKLLEEHKGDDVVALDLRKLNLWTDFFIISTVSSNAHLQGLQRHVKEYAGEQGFNVQRQTRREGNAVNNNSHGFTDGASFAGGGWNLIDMGTVVIHLMTIQSREFYELEALWSSAERVYPVNN
ncbi:MAG: RsfS/YbeB/iojap family protein [Treponema sp.]|nr:RsfS/YbeB/iojap family protein [Treponema sp.]